MLLSISSFSSSCDKPNWVWSIVLAAVLGCTLVLSLEFYLRSLGMEPNVKDSARLWSSKRAEATTLSKDDFIVIGGSRTQLGFDTNLWSELTGRKVVQLSIDGAPVIKSLKDLAEDKKVVATIIVSANLANLKEENAHKTDKWIRLYKKEYRSLIWPRIEQKLIASIESYSVLYSTLYPPYKMLDLLIHKRNIGKAYLKTLPNRDREADYSLVRQPDFYVARVMRNLGVNVLDTQYQEKNKISIQNFENMSDEVKRVVNQKASERQFSLSDYNDFFKAMDKGRKKSEIILLKMPTSGLVKYMEDAFYPKELWETVMNKNAYTSVDYRDYSNLQYELADGSHLDLDQRSKFTREYYNIFSRGY